MRIAEHARHFGVALFAAVAAGAGALAEVGPPAPGDIAAARQAADLLAERLRAQLSKALQAGGPAAAIDVCAVAAPAIAADVSTETGYTVGRTALRVRNPDNAPDAWERRRLLDFEQRVAAGGSPAALERSEIVATAAGPVFRWARPILLDGPCATCHGVAVDPALLADIRRRYPEDAATGFAVGAMRGMFTVTRPLSTD